MPDLDYDHRVAKVESLYERAKQAQWNASTDVDWSVPVPFGEPLPDDSAFAMASFESSPLARRGRPMWDSFRWELQAWMVSQFLHGEQGALVFPKDAPLTARAAATRHSCNLATVAVELTDETGRALVEVAATCYDAVPA